MSTLSAPLNEDPRALLTRDMYFCMQPVPLRRYLVRLRLGEIASEVFWEHWQEGQFNGTWCSEIPLAEMTRRLGACPSSITRAYQTLQAHGLIRRAAQGRAANNPYRQAVSLTEVLIPSAALPELLNAPRRGAKRCTANTPVQHAPAPREAPTPVRTGLSARARLQLFRRLSDTEQASYQKAAKEGGYVEFDATNRFTPEERACIQRSAVSCHTQPAPPAARSTPQCKPTVSLFILARLRQRVSALVPSGDVDRRVQEILWSATQGVFRKEPLLLALNASVKLLRERRWERPRAMPGSWTFKMQCPSPAPTQR